MARTFIIGEIGINHNGDLEIAKKLIDGAVVAGCNMVKFQKRTLDVVYTKEDLDRHRESPWGTTNREQKHGLEFEKKEYDEIDRYCKVRGIEWTASAWDVRSQLFLRKYNLNYNNNIPKHLHSTHTLNHQKSHFQATNHYMPLHQVQDRFCQ